MILVSTSSSYLRQTSVRRFSGRNLHRGRADFLLRQTFLSSNEKKESEATSFTVLAPSNGNYSEVRECFFEPDLLSLLPGAFGGNHRRQLLGCAVDIIVKN